MPSTGSRALDVFARPDIPGLTRLQDRVGLRHMAPHLMGIGTATEFVWANHSHLRPAPTHA